MSTKWNLSEPHASPEYRRRLWLAAILLGVAYLAVGLLTLHDYHNWGDDWAQYVAHARNLALGKPYADTGYLFNPGAPAIGPAVSQPGLPLLLAPAYKLFGLNLLALKATGFLFLCGGIALAAVALADTFGATIALLAAALFALHPAVLWLRQVVLTESPFIFFTFLAIILAKQRWRHTDRLHIVTYSVLTGLILVAAYATRLIAVALVTAIVVDDLQKRRPILIGMAPLLATFGAGMLLLRNSAAFADYSIELQTASRAQSDALPLLAALWQRVDWHFSALSEVVRLPFQLSKPAAVLLLAVALIGTLSVCCRKAATTNAKPVSPVLAAVTNCPLEVWYLGAYLAALVVLPVYRDLRLLLPILPILFALTIYGFYVLLKRFGWHRKSVLTAVMASLCLYYVGLQFHVSNGAWRFRADPGEIENGAFCTDCKSMYAFVAAQIPRDARVAFVKPRALALLTGHQSWGMSQNAPQESTWEAMRQSRIKHLVVPRPDYALAPMYPDYLSWQALAKRPDISVIYSNSTFRVYELK
jgi:4-amino-4-deoxy-L-arabinose transferase-like glycosyltransferase